jgi:hypothetical protein
MPSGLAICRSFFALGGSVTSKESSHMRSSDSYGFLWQDRCSAKVHGLQVHSLLILSIVFALFSVNLLIGYPGAVSYDGRLQYAQAVTGQFSDWHPPIMARVWSILRLVADGSGPLFAVHVFCYWLGFGLIALTLSLMRRNKTAWAVVAAGVFPPFMFMNVAILKDVSMAVAFISAFSISFFYRVRGLKIPFTYLIIAMGLIIYGALVRVNGIFGAVPLFIYLVYPALFWRPIYLVVVSLALIATWIPAATLFNHRVLRATPSNAISSLKRFDLAGIAYFSEDKSVYGSETSVTAELVRECYTPVGWETLVWRENCRPALGYVWPSTRDWISAIIRHPVAYATHRLAHFNSELFFIVPRNDANYGSLLRQDRDMIASYLTSSLFPSPVVIISNLIVFGLVMGVVIVGLCYRSSRPRALKLDDAVACLGISGVVYALTYFIIGVSTSPRYQYWSLMAVCLASIIFLSRREHGSLSRLEWASVGVLAVMLITLISIPNASLSSSSPELTHITERF